jgi:hypothetical protein
MEGYLMTKEGTGWKLLYYRLQQDKLFYFENHEDVKPLGFHAVYDVVSIDKNSSTK